MDINELIKIRNKIYNAVEGNGSSVLGAINILDTFIYEYKNDKKLNIHAVSYCDLDNAKIGDKIVFSKVFKQSKRYTAGLEYEFIKVKKDSWRDEIGVRDDRGRLVWISRNGISFSEYKVISCS